MLNLRRRATFAALATLVLPAAAAAQQFEGVISLRMSGSGKAAGQTQDADYYASRSGKARIELNSPIGKAAIIMAPADGKMYMMMDRMSQYVEQELGDVSNSSTMLSGERPRITHTGRKETIAGYECEHITVNDIDICGASGLGVYLNFGANLMSRGGIQPWQSAVLEENVFPLKVTLPDGTVQMLVTKIEKKVVDPEMFRVPANFSKIAMPPRGG